MKLGLGDPNEKKGKDPRLERWPMDSRDHNHPHIKWIYGKDQIETTDIYDGDRVKTTEMHEGQFLLENTNVLCMWAYGRSYD